jgi:hypothetical protein
LRRLAAVAELAAPAPAEGYQPADRLQARKPTGDFLLEDDKR